MTTAALALGVSRRMLAYYRSGAKPVPRTVALACLGWEEVMKNHTLRLKAQRGFSNRQNTAFVGNISIKINGLRLSLLSIC